MLLPAPRVTEGQHRGVPVLSQQRPHLRHLPRGQAWGLEAPQVVLRPAHGAGAVPSTCLFCVFIDRACPSPAGL